MNSSALELLKQAETWLQQAQNEGANRDRAIAITHLQTAILWLEKSEKLSDR